MEEMNQKHILFARMILMAFIVIAAFTIVFVQPSIPAYAENLTSETTDRSSSSPSSPSSPSSEMPEGFTIEELVERSSDSFFESNALKEGPLGKSVLRSSDSVSQSVSLRWKPSTGVSSDGLSLVDSANTSNNRTLSAALTYVYSGTETALPGTIKITLPQDIFRDRVKNLPLSSIKGEYLQSNGNIFKYLVASYSMPLPKKGLSSANWVYSVVGDMIVIENGVPTSTGTRLDVEFSYMYSPVMVVNGFHNAFSVHCEYNGAEIVSNEIDVTTDFKTTSAYNILSYRITQFSTWNPIWGDKPANADSKNFILVQSNDSAYISASPLAYMVDVAVTVNGVDSGYEIVSNRAGGSNNRLFDVPLRKLFRNGGSDPNRCSQYDNSYREDVFVFPTLPVYGGTSVQYTVLALDKPDPSTSSLVSVSINSKSFSIDNLTSPVDEKQKTLNLTYRDISFIYEGDNYSMTISGEPLAANNSWALTALSKGSVAAVTLHSNGQSTLFNEELGEFAYSVDSVFLNGMPLNPSDYSLSSPLSLGNYGLGSNINIKVVKDAPVDINDTEVSIPIEDYRISIKIKTRSNPNWHEYGIMVPPEGEVLLGGLWNLSTDSPYLNEFFKDWPSDVISYSIGLDNPGKIYSFSYSYGLSTYVTINPTEHVLNIIDGAENAIVHPMGAIIGKDSHGKSFAIRTNDNVVGNKDIANKLKISDMNTYGYLPYRCTSPTTLGKNLPQVNLNSSGTSQSSLPYYQKINMRTKCAFRINTGISDLATLAKIEEAGIVTAVSSGDLYFLLPFGVTFSDISIFGHVLQDDKTVNRVPLTSESKAIKQYKNWRDSNKTMVKVSFSFPNEYKNRLFVPNEKASQQIDLELGTSYSYAAYKQYGGNISIPTALQSSFLDLYQGSYPDDGKGFADPQTQLLFEHLNVDGASVATENNTLYAEPVLSFAYDVAYEAGSQEMISNETEYSDSITVPLGTRYSYDLSYRTSTAVDASKATDMIIYDRLGEPGPETGKISAWKGSYESLDYRQLKISGIDYKTYYSTQPLDLSIEENRDLTDTSKWTSTEPSDKTSIKTIAVDCRKKTDGTDFVLESGKYVSVIVNMIASDDVVSISKYSYNTHHVSSRAGDVGSTAPVTCVQSNVTSAYKSANPVSISKSSDPVSGTLDSPTVVVRDSLLTYDLLITNQSESVVSDVTVTDKIPADLICDVSQATGNRNNRGFNELRSLGITAEKKADGTLAFTISEMAARETLVLKIPTSVSGYGTFANKAVVTSFNGFSVNVESNTVYHVANPESFDFSFIKTGTNDVPLKGAEFALYRWIGVGAADYSTDVSDSSLWSEDARVQTPEDGSASFTFLSGKEYRIVETKAPDGYEVPHGDWKAGYSSTTGAVKIESNGFPPAFEKKDGTYYVKNYPSYLIPLAIGISPYAFVICGLALLGSAIVLSVRMKTKMKKSR